MLTFRKLFVHWQIAPQIRLNQVSSARPVCQIQLSVLLHLACVDLENSEIAQSRPRILLNVFTHSKIHICIVAQEPHLCCVCEHILHCLIKTFLKYIKGIYCEFTAHFCVYTLSGFYHGFLEHDLIFSLISTPVSLVLANIIADTYGVQRNAQNRADNRSRASVNVPIKYQNGVWVLDTVECKLSSTAAVSEILIPVHLVPTTTPYRAQYFFIMTYNVIIN